MDRLAERIADPDDFAVLPGSSLAGDDRACHPFEVSQAVRHLINASVDQLHGAKTLIHVAQMQHLAVGSTLARAALENTATAIWILGPRKRNDRTERVLRWHARNYQDEASTVGHLVGDAPTRHLDRIKAVAEARGVPPEVAANGYRVTAPIAGAMPYTDMDLKGPEVLVGGRLWIRPRQALGLPGTSGARDPPGRRSRRRATVDAARRPQPVAPAPSRSSPR